MTEPLHPGTAPALAPGWYVTGPGQIQWFDGIGWSQPMPAPPASAPIPWAAFAHFGGILFPIVVPLVIRQTVGATDPVVRHHATEALNAQIFALLFWWVAWLPTWLVLARLTPGSAPPLWMFVVLGLGLIAQAAVFGLSLRGGHLATRGVLWRYPLPFRFVRGSAPRTAMKGRD